MSKVALCEWQFNQIIAALNEQTAKLCEIADGLCIDKPEGVTLDRRCLSYSNMFTSGYNNWNDPDDFKGLADEFGISPTEPFQHWVRIIEHDCGGVAQSTVGTILGPYTVGAGSNQQMLNDLATATAGTCLVVSPSSNAGPNGNDTGLQYDYDSTQDSTLVLQEGVSVGGGVAWYSSAQGVAVRSGEVGDFIVSGGVSNPSNFAATSAAEDFEQFASGQDCEAL